jgi:diguanylate cyclase (GGDEF)-like protein/PAS domain S-box-containing protein
MALKDFMERAVGEHGLSERDLHIILDALPTPLSWATLADGKIQFVNRAFKTLFGYAENAFPTVDDWIDRAYVKLHQQEEARKRWKELWTDRASGIGEVDVIELEVICSDRSIRTVQHRGILLHDIGIGIATFDDISDRKRVEETLFRLAYEDPLTGLPNRRFLQERWSEYRTRPDASDRPSAALLIDMDDFKAVNDQCGHDAGDAVLLAMAERLKASMRDDDLVCRLGGDEFVILLQGIGGYDEVRRTCSRIEAALNKPVTIPGGTVTISASIGASLFPQDGADLKTLLKRADEALYRVKNTRKGGWAWFKAPLAA